MAVLKMAMHVWLKIRQTSTASGFGCIGEFDGGVAVESSAFEGSGPLRPGHGKAEKAETVLCGSLDGFNQKFPSS